MKALCDIIVLTWNRKDLIEGFIESFLRNTDTPSRLIVIDNASSDGTSEYLLSLKDTEKCSFKIILNNENKGFVGGMNQGIVVSDAPYVCLANNDLLFTRGWLEEIINIFQKYPKAGLLNPNSNNLGMRFPENGIFLEDFSEDLRSRYGGVFIEMPFCIGFCMIIKRDVIDKIGALSEDFYPAFFEDSDYSLRAVRAGYRIGMAKGSYVWHKEHASFDRTDKKQTEKLFKRNRDIFVRKWGEMLRIALIADNHRELKENIHKVMETARSGKYVHVYCRNLMKDMVIAEHSGVKFVNFNNYFDLFFKVMIKKKRYNVISRIGKFNHELYRINCMRQ